MSKFEDTTGGQNWEELGNGNFMLDVLNLVFLRDISRDINKIIKNVILNQWVSNFNERQKHPKSLISQIAGPTSRVSD